VISLAEERFAFRSVARHPKHGVAMRIRAVEQDREQQSARNLARSRTAAQSFQRSCIAARKPMHQGAASTGPSSIFSKIGACRFGARERLSPFALKLATIACIAASVLSAAVAIRRRVGPTSRRTIRWV